MDPKSYIKLLGQAGQALQAIRDAELMNSAPHPAVAINALSGPFLYSLRAMPPGPTSGLVEMQRYFAGLRK